MERTKSGVAAELCEGALYMKKDRMDKQNVLTARARQQAIGRELRRMYDNVVNEPVPADFLELLRRIDDSRDNKGNETK